MARISRFLVAGALSLLLGSLASRSKAVANDQVTVRADVFLYGADIPIIVGIVDGIYAKHGIDAQLLAGRGSATTIQTVANQSDQFGFADGAALTKLVAKGLRAKQVMGVLQSTSMAVMTFPDSGLKRPKDLDGKTTGFAPGSATDEIFPAFAKRTGIDMSTIKGLSVDPTTRDNLFLLKKIDFDIALTVAQLPILQDKCQCTLHLMKFADNGINLVSNGIVASDELIEKNPDLVKRFVAATVEATKKAIADPAHGVDDFMAYAKNAGVSRDVVAEQWAQAIKVLHTRRTADKPIGMMGAKDWQDTIDILTQYAGLPADTVKPEMLFTNQFVPN
jgi:NitT/TauT family transport system substrate-binding protein